MTEKKTTTPAEQCTTKQEAENPPAQALSLREQAEVIFWKQLISYPKCLDSVSSEAFQQTQYDLDVRQIELELQIQEMQQSQIALNTARACYFDLYNRSPVGYFTLSEDGTIIDANLVAATLLGVEREALSKKPISRFIFKKDSDEYYL
ncbi:MAG: PAS domain-containing protein, partial [Azonexus sp.]|nr:PAS domain-containing protein [Azonexus sp.]